MGGILTPCCIQSEVQDKFQGSSGAALGGAGREGQRSLAGTEEPVLLPRGTRCGDITDPALISGRVRRQRSGF